MANHAILDLAASASAVLLFLFAARSFVVGSNREPLGWGFGLASGAILAYLVKDSVGGFGGGLRLGLGILLILPALRALVDPRSTSIVTAVVGLVIAFAVAGGPVRALVHSFGPATPQSELARTRSELATLEQQRGRAQDILKDLVLKREELKRELRALNLPESSLLDHPKVSLLATVLDAQEKWEQALVVIDKEITAKTLRTQALEAGLEIEQMTQSNPDLAEVLRDLDSNPTDPQNGDLIERTMHRDKMREMLAKELR
ncbi:MAG TPA: hypothetical protein P5218_09685 [Planctomycetota bacterium]|nr:hypothetical protein [Planctomycetota bacterium]